MSKNRTPTLFDTTNVFFNGCMVMDNGEMLGSIKRVKVFIPEGAGVKFEGDETKAERIRGLYPNKIVLVEVPRAFQDTAEDDIVCIKVSVDEHDVKKCIVEGNYSLLTRKQTRDNRENGK